MSSFFPRVNIASEFAPFLRLLDEATSGAASSTTALRTFQPRFDVREEKDSFHLTGELPGIAQENIQIEFVDQNTLTIHGRTVREESRGTPPSKAIEENKDADNTDDGVVVENPDSSSSSYHKATVEDEDSTTTDGSAVATPTTSNAEVAKTTPSEAPKKAEQPKSKYWVSERHVGEFHRSFSFPGQVNQDAVTANLKDGILTVVVPKAVQKQPRRITVQ